MSQFHGKLFIDFLSCAAEQSFFMQSIPASLSHSRYATMIFTTSEPLPQSPAELPPAPQPFPSIFWARWTSH